MADGDVKDYAGEKKKPSIALVISVGPKMPKKPEDTSTPDEPMKKAWDTLVKYVGTYDISKNAFIPLANTSPSMNEFQPGQPLVDEMGRPMMERNEENKNIYDEYGLPYRMPVRQYIESSYGRPSGLRGLRDTPQQRALHRDLHGGLHIDQEQLRQERPDLFEMPNPMDAMPSRNADGKEMVAGTSRSRFRSRADDPESRDAENMTQAIDAAFSPAPKSLLDGRNKIYYTHPTARSKSWSTDFYQNAPKHIRDDVKTEPVVRDYDSDEYGPHTIGQKTRPDEGPEAFDVKQRLNRPFRPRSNYSKDRNKMTKAFEILKIRSAAPPRKPGAFRRRMPPTPEPEPEPEPEPMEEGPDPEMEARAKQSVVDAINRIRRKRDKFDESKEVVPTSIEEQEGDVEDLPFSHFLKPPEER